MVTAALAVYGSRTAIIFYNTYDKVVQEYTLRVNEDDECYWEKTKDKIKISKQTRIFSPANSRAILDNLAYRQCIEFWTKAGYALRYSGALSADVYHLLAKGEGVYCSIGSKLQKKKLRILYECAPIAFLVEQAGGLSSNGEISLLDVKVDGYYQKTDFIVGSKEEVQRVQRFYVFEKEKKQKEKASKNDLLQLAGLPQNSQKKYRIQEKKDSDEEEEGDQDFF